MSDFNKRIQDKKAELNLLKKKTRGTFAVKR